MKKKTTILNTATNDRKSLASEALKAKDHLGVSRILFPKVTKQEIHYLIAHALRSEKLSIADSVSIMQDINPRHFQLALKHIEESYDQSKPQSEELAYLIKKKAIEDADGAFAHVIEMKMKNHRAALALISTMGGSNWQNYLNMMKGYGVNAHDAASIFHLRVPEEQTGLAQLIFENLGKVSSYVKYTQFYMGMHIESALSGLNAFEAISRNWPVVRKYKNDLSFGAMVKQSKCPNYKDILDPKFEIEAARAGLDHRKFSRVQDMYLLSKDTPVALPTLNNPWVLSKKGKKITFRRWESKAGISPVVGFFADKSNYKNLFYGEYTNSNDKFEGQYHLLLQYFQQSPEATFFVVTLKDNPNGIIAQSPVIKRGNTLIIESIETAGQLDYIEAVEEVYQKAADSLVQYHFERVELATTLDMKNLGMDFEHWPHSNSAKQKYPKGYKGPSDYWTVEFLPEFSTRVLAVNKNYVKARAQLDNPEAVTMQLTSPDVYLSLVDEVDRDDLQELAQTIRGNQYELNAPIESIITLRTLAGEIIGYADVDRNLRIVYEVTFKKGTSNEDIAKLLNAVASRMKLVGGDWKIAEQSDACEQLSKLIHYDEDEKLNIDILSQASKGQYRSKNVAETKHKLKWWNISTEFKRVVD